MEAALLIVLLVITAIANLGVTPVPGVTNTNPAVDSNVIAYMQEQSNTALDIGKTDLGSK
jgi:hypothetical protein